MSTFVLVHGAWHGRWCWDRVEDGLRAAGHRTVSTDLPVDDGSATFLDYRDAVLGAWPGEGDDVVLVGHSLGAMVLPLVADLRPVAASAYVCPVVPNVDGMPWDDVPEMGAERAYETVTHDDGSVTFESLDAAVFTFFGTCTPSDAAWAFARLRPQNSASLWDRPYPIRTLPPGRRLVLGGRHDRAVTPAFLSAAAVRRLGVEPVWLDCDHSPFLSDVPGLVDVLLDTATSTPR